MLKPNFRFFIVPLGAISTLATLASQTPELRTQRDSATSTVREQVTYCGLKNPANICVIAPGSDIR